LNTDSERETLAESIRNGEITWRCWWDGKVGPISTAWRIEGFPAIFVFDTNGIMRFKRVQRKALDQAVDSLLKAASQSDKSQVTVVSANSPFPARRRRARPSSGE
jgi:hypothetical protein